MTRGPRYPGRDVDKNATKETQANLLIHSSSRGMDRHLSQIPLFYFASQLSVSLVLSRTAGLFMICPPSVGRRFADLPAEYTHHRGRVARHRRHPDDAGQLRYCAAGLSPHISLVQDPPKCPESPRGCPDAKW
jgi:hypothetical protein